MSLKLAKPIANFIDANARLDIEGMTTPFSPDAVLLDNGKTFEGQAAIRRLFDEEVLPVKAIFTPETATDDNGDIVLEGPGHGNFPGSPIRFTYRFTLAENAIKTLKISV
ncbi:hypothetical protein SAMN05428969_0263 [Devosia sp. YR412]|uniref:nuclear transport factor 2 family protein n=1 Tax=Devosia sp. YR412 TaxID=1881030 RepID=UPI0008BE6286|nr:nuclear transport factor 2 family protein [Devosia sp. YR412]SEP64013.1 hypothetical protein SAMN05428969_0263 [Devosia sp. YR412]